MTKNKMGNLNTQSATKLCSSCKSPFICDPPATAKIIMVHIKLNADLLSAFI